jgi:hypothetical protein
MFQNFNHLKQREVGEIKKLYYLYVNLTDKLNLIKPGGTYP